MEKQVSKNAYTFGSYTKIDRWSSYFYQLREILSRSPTSVLEVGIGEGIVRDYIKCRTTIHYQSIDVAEDLEPSMIGSVTSIPLPDDSVDIVCAFEILEHLPFEQFEKSVAELFRVTKKNVIISLPHFGPPIIFEFKIPFLPRIRFAWKLPFPQRHVFDGQHYWEIGKHGYSAGMIRAVLQTHGTLEFEFVPFENQYHHFFILRKNA